MARIIPLPRRSLAPVAASTSARKDEAVLYGDGDLLIAGVLFWLASVARVIVAIFHHEVFGVETSLALLCVVLLPWISWRSRSKRASGSKACVEPAEDERSIGIVVPFVRAAPGPAHDPDTG